jgi:hypothetical protein
MQLGELCTGRACAREGAGRLARLSPAPCPSCALVRGIRVSHTVSRACSRCRCLALMKGVQWSADGLSFSCPQHACCMCDEAPAANMLLCNRCPAAFHVACVEEQPFLRLNRRVIVCPVHEPKGPTLQVDQRVPR